jgi:hypothetical protein
MPESERLETLALLAQNRSEAEAKLAALPITVETHSMVRCRNGHACVLAWHALLVLGLRCCHCCVCRRTRWALRVHEG